MSPVRAAGGRGRAGRRRPLPVDGHPSARGPSRFFVSPAWRAPSFRLARRRHRRALAGDEAVGLAPNSYGVRRLDGPPRSLLSYVLLGVAALHPSMARPLATRGSTRPARQPLAHRRAHRRAAHGSGGALLEQTLRGTAARRVRVLGLGVVLSLLVVGRLTGILRALERIRLREERARLSAEETRTSSWSRTRGSSRRTG